MRLQRRLLYGLPSREGGDGGGRLVPVRLQGRVHRHRVQEPHPPLFFNLSLFFWLYFITRSLSNHHFSDECMARSWLCCINY